MYFLYFSNKSIYDRAPMLASLMGDYKAVTVFILPFFIILTIGLVVLCSFKEGNCGSELPIAGRGGVKLRV